MEFLYIFTKYKGRFLIKKEFPEKRAELLQGVEISVTIKGKLLIKHDF